MDSRQEFTSVSTLCNDAKDTAQQLLNHYVKVQGLAISQVGISFFSARFQTFIP